MPSPRNGNPVNSASDLPAIVSPTPVDTAQAIPAQAPASEAARLEVTASETTVTSEGPNLAEEARRRRHERRARRHELDAQWLHLRAEFLLKRRVPHLHGGDGKVEDIDQDVEEQRKPIQEAVRRGSKKHRRQPKWIRAIPKCVLVFDFGLLLYFFGGITNVYWANPLSMALAFAVLLAAMVTVLSYGFLTYTGLMLRSYKDHDGAVVLHDLDWSSKLAVAIATAVIVMIAMLMFLRMRTEVLYALGSQADMTALVIAAALAVVSMAANFLVISIHAHDGSDEVADLDRMSASTRRHAAKARKMRERAVQKAIR